RLSVASVELPDGTKFEQYVMRMRKCAMTVVLDEAGVRVLLVWRHRFIIDRWVWELPGGYVDTAEDGAMAAAREVVEETGYRPRSVEYVMTFQPIIGSADQAPRPPTSPARHARPHPRQQPLRDSQNPPHVPSPGRRASRPRPSSHR